MLEKIDIYDIVTSFVHGTLFVMACLVLFPQCLDVVRILAVPEIVATLMFVSLTYFLGQSIVAVSSILQKALFWTWGGTPSECVFNGRFPKKYLSSDMIDHVREVLKRTTSDELSDEALFLKASGIARASKGSLSERHNQMYAYNRVTITNLLLVIGLVILSRFEGLGANISLTGFALLLGVLVLLLILHWIRARQRAFYYVREVLVAAERGLEGGV